MRLTIDARRLKTASGEAAWRGGVPRYCHELITRILDLDSELRLTLVVPPKNDRPVVQGTHAGRVREVPYGPPSHSIRTLCMLSRRVPLADTDIFHSPFGILPWGLPCRTVTTVHDVMWLQDPRYISAFLPYRAIASRFYRVAIMSALERSDRIAAVSEATRDAIVHFCPEARERIRITPNGVDPFFRPLDAQEAERETAHLVPPGSPFVLVVGNLSPHKNHPRAIEAFLSAFRDHPEMRLVIVRRFSRIDSHMRRLARRADVKRRVTFLPSVTDEQLRALYGRARILLFPSLAEGFGIPPLEAMACGTPVVTSDRGALSEVVGDAAVKVDPWSVESIAAGLRTLHADEALARRLVQEGAVRARSFTWDDCARRTLALYQELMREEGPLRHGVGHV